MRKLAVITASLLFTAPVLAQSVGEKSGVNSALGVSPSTADFVKKAAISDMFEIQSSQLAAQRANEPAKAFASQMLTDHQKTSNELKSMVRSGTEEASVPSDLDSSHQKMLDKLKGLNGADFTKQYDKDQVSAHKDAVSLFRRYAKGGDDAALKDWAGKTLPDLERHLEMAQNLER
jgi:putative membrane protein